MAKEYIQQLPDGPEFRLLGNLFGALIASAGLLAGTMARERSFDYWLEDIVPLLLLVFTVRGVLLNAVRLAQEAIIYDEKMEMLRKAMGPAMEQPADADLDLPLLPRKKGYTEEEVLEAVSKRIQEKREEAVKSNKLIN
ncbi:hypothetical protein [Trichlorobacter ammonificans]|uniref:Uncharacterized protein n=1 Tax=Trichlorobacter ammonificans TaxID=2916410 RepID=A0ABM9D7A9_9BACT|nr:hypothetical protein [Trichlorobacter ammonificans]CAH2030614.1 conserved protein of unknown function [Trichlorobacter ammonificans]